MPILNPILIGGTEPTGRFGNAPGQISIYQFIIGMWIPTLAF